jgi:hypothetical protein
MPSEMIPSTIITTIGINANFSDLPISNAKLSPLVHRKQGLKAVKEWRGWRPAYGKRRKRKKK